MQRSAWIDTRFKMLRSWLGERTANVAVGGALSRDLRLADMVYQGTGCGPPLWNVFLTQTLGRQSRRQALSTPPMLLS